MRLDPVGHLHQVFFRVHRLGLYQRAHHGAQEVLLELHRVYEDAILLEVADELRHADAVRQVAEEELVGPQVGERVCSFELLHVLLEVLASVKRAYRCRSGRRRARCCRRAARPRFGPAPGCTRSGRSSWCSLSRRMA